MRRKLRTVLIGVLVATLTVDPAMAFHGFGRYWSCYEPCVVECEPVCYSHPCGACESCGPCETMEVVECESCGPCGEMQDGAPMTEETLPAVEPPAMTEESESSPDEMLVVPEVPATHEPEPSIVNKPAEMPTMPEDEEEATEPSGEWEPAADEGEDLFGPSSDESSDSEDLFGPSEETEEEAAPAEEAPAEEPMVEEPTEMEEEPAEAESEDDLFGGPAEEESMEPAEEAAEESIEEPAEEESMPTEEAPAEEEAAPAEEEEEAGADDLFGGVEANLREPGGLASAELRQWNDNTGRYSCRGRLISVLDGSARLLKDNGRTTTVPLGRLSVTDMEFVQRQASAQRTEVVGQTAQHSPVWLGN